jgi:hypothetical protein
MVTLQLIALSNDGPTPNDGEYVVEYDPVPRMAPGGEFIHLVTTPNRDDARQFPTVEAAMECWRSTSGRFRPDGKMDRPLTAYTVEVSIS